MWRRRDQVGLDYYAVDDVSRRAYAVAAFEDVEVRTAFDYDLEPRIDPLGRKPLHLRVFLLQLPVQLIIDDAIASFLFTLLVRISRVVVISVRCQSLQ